MATGYSGTTGNCPRYVCARAKQLYAGEHVCQSIGGVRLENRVLDEMFDVLAPAALTASAQRKLAWASYSQYAQVGSPLPQSWARSGTR